MCKFFKDDGEQCGMDTEPFCRHHDDTAQAAQYAADSGSSTIVMETTCSDCESSLRRTERLTDHPRQGGRVLFEAVVECDCAEHVLGAQSVRTSDVPSGWQ